MDAPDQHRAAPQQRPARLKVMFVINGLDIGGAEQQLAELLLRIDRERFHPIVCCVGRRGPIADILEGAAVAVTEIGVPRPQAWRLVDAADIVRRLWRFVRFIFAERPHVVIGLHFGACILATFAAAAARVPVVLSTRLSLARFKQGRPVRRILERLANPLTDVVIANGEAVRLDAIRDEGLPPEKVIVIRNGIDVHRFELSRDSRLRQDLGGDGNRPIIAVIANFLHYKGHDTFLLAWRRVLARHPHAVAVLVGDGPLRASLNATAAELGVSSTVKFLGTRRDVPRLLAAVDIVAHPSVEEGTANAILEALAAGKPVVATAVGGNVEAIIHQQTGLLVPVGDHNALADAICRFIEHPDEASTFGRSGRAHVAAQYDMDAMVRGYQLVFERAWCRATAR